MYLWPQSRNSLTISKESHPPQKMPLNFCATIGMLIETQKSHWSSKMADKLFSTKLMSKIPRNKKFLIILLRSMFWRKSWNNLTRDKRVANLGKCRPFRSNFPRACLTISRASSHRFHSRKEAQDPSMFRMVNLTKFRICKWERRQV